MGLLLPQMLQSNYDARGPAEDVDTSPRLSSVRYGVNGSSLDTDTRHSDLDGVNSGVNSGSSVDFSDSLDTKHISPAVPRTRSGFVPAPTRGFRAAAYNIGLGFSDKIGLVLNRANQLSIDMLALTEVGDPRVNDRLIQSYGYRYIACLKRHAGVMLLFRSDLAASLRKPMDSSTSGRLVGGVFEIAGKTSLIVSAYLPSGLDGKSESSDEAADAKDIYRCIGRWSALADNTLVLGDLNETVSDRDRSENTAGVRHRRFISSLLDSGFTDCFRSLHSKGGFTCKTPVPGRVALSRIDYVLAKGWGSTPARACAVDDFLALSRHQLLWADVGSSDVSAPAFVTQRRCLFNVRRASPQQLQQSATSLGNALADRMDFLLSLANGEAKDLDNLAESILGLAERAARRHLPITGQKPSSNGHLAAICNRRKRLCEVRSAASLIHSTGGSFGSKDWQRVSRGRHSSIWADWGDPANDWAKWISNADDAIRNVRKEEREVKRQMHRSHNDTWQHNQEAEVHRMLRGRPADIPSVVNPKTNKLTSSPDELKGVLANHFEESLNNSRNTSEKLSLNQWSALQSMYEPKASIDPSWFVGLMAPSPPAEVLTTLRSGKYIVAPGGTDRISTGLWRALAERDDGVLTCITLLVNACLRLAYMPQCGKSSVINPILKSHSQERVLSNLRPISLQCGLTKILSKLLAARLNAIFASQPVLHSAQEAFLRGHSSFCCVDICLDVWEHARQFKRACFNVFYDIRAAYDSVRHADIIRALERIRLPSHFVDFVESSLSGLKSCVRTCYGNSRWFAVSRSVRQGDPMAPLLYIIFMDPLHCGLEQNPLFDNLMDGYAVSGACVASKGFADDIWIVSSSAQGLRRMHRWVETFCIFNCLFLNGSKTVLTGRNADRSQIGDIIQINGSSVAPLEEGKSVRYLGAWINMDLDYDDQCSKISSTIGYYCHLAVKFRLSIDRTVVFFNRYLMPKLELPLRYAQPTAEQCHRWDAAIGRVISELANAARTMKTEAVASSLGLILPSSLEKTIKISEAFLRLNSSDSVASMCARSRWQAVSHDQRSSSVSRAVRTSALARSIGVSFQPTKAAAALAIDPGLPSYGEKVHGIIDGFSCCYVFGPRRLWGSSFPKHTVQIFTAAYSPPKLVDPGNQQPSGWGVCIGDDRLHQSASLFLSAKRKHRLGFRSMMSALGGKILPFVPQGVYVSRLVAIVHALLCVPVVWDVAIFCTQGSIDALRWFEAAPTDRHRLKLCGNSILRCIQLAISARASVGASTSLIRYCQDVSSAPELEAAGKTMASLLADASCSTFGLPICALPAAASDVFVSLLNGNKPIHGHVRKHIRKIENALVVDRWAVSRSQSRFCSPAAEPFVRRIRDLVADGDLQYQHIGFALRLLTDSVHFAVEEDEKSGRHLEVKLCNLCDIELEVDAYHLFTCTDSESVRRRKALVAQLVELLRQAKASPRWIADRASAPLMVFIRDLFHTVDHAGRADNDRRLRSAFGCFSTDELASAMATVGASDSALWAWIDREMRKLLVSHAYDEWCRRKT